MTRESAEIRAAGGVVRRLDADGTPRVLLIHRDRYDDWTFPKGKREPGETGKTTARREVAEEAGIQVRLEAKLPSIQYEVDGAPKQVRYWLMAWAGDSPNLRDEEVDDLRWCTVSEARDLLTYEHDVPLLDAIDPTTRPGRLWVVRHAKAGSRKEYDGPDPERPLSKTGRRQARAVATELRDQPIARIISSASVRCMQTVEPLAVRLGLMLETDVELAEEHDDRAIWRWCAQPEPVVLCSHGDVLDAMVTTLADRGLIPPDHAAMPEKGSIWRLTTRGGAVIDARYSPPVPQRVLHLG